MQASINIISISHSQPRFTCKRFNERSTAAIIPIAANGKTRNKAPIPSRPPPLTIRMYPKANIASIKRIIKGVACFSMRLMFILQ